MIVNSLFGIMMSDPRTLPQILAVIAGISTFIWLYSSIDHHLTRHHQYELRKALYIGVVIKTFTQLMPFIEMFAGALALGLAGAIFSLFAPYDLRWPETSPEIPALPVFFYFYLAVVIDGILLSIIVLIITSIISFNTIDEQAETGKQAE